MMRSLASSLLVAVGLSSCSASSSPTAAMRVQSVPPTPPPVDVPAAIPDDMTSIVRVDVQQLRGLPNGPLIIEFALFGRKHAAGPSDACAATAASWIEEMWVFRRKPDNPPLYAMQTSGAAPERAACWSQLDPRWLPLSIGKHPGFVRDDLALVSVGDWIITGPRADVEAALARLGRPTKGTRSSLFARPGMFAATYGGPYAITGAKSGWAWVSADPQWLRSEAAWEFETPEAASAWVSTRTTDVRPHLQRERGSVVQGKVGVESVNLPYDRASAKRAVWALDGLIRTGRPSYLASSLPCAPLASGTLSREGVESATLHARGAQRCYEELLRRDRDARGKMLVDLRVEADGSICHTDVLESTFEDERFHECILALASRSSQL